MQRILFTTILLMVLVPTRGQDQNPSQQDLDQLKQQLKQEILQELQASNKDLDDGDEEEREESQTDWTRFRLNGYGAVNYYNYQYDTDKNIKDKFDPERLNLYLQYHFNSWISFKSEIEFEHGGTGSSIELDTQEEFGEYEQEVEAGGEVKMEQININFDIAPYFNVRVGRFKVYFGLAQNLDEPTKYFTAHRQEMENVILPLGWYENGVEFHGYFAKDRLSYNLTFTNGLDGTGFSSRNWIKDGYQQRFDMVNTEAFAVMGRLDYHFGHHHDTYAGLAGYLGNSAPNRPKNDMDVSAYVSMVEGHVSYNEGNLRFNSILLFGNLENSDVVSRANAKLSNNLGVKRTPVGQQALGFSAEAGYNLMPFIKSQTAQKLYPFVRYDYYDTMYSTEGNVVDKPRWERSGITEGINWFVTDEVVLKAHYQVRTLGSENFDPATLVYTGEHQKEKTFSVGIGFEF